MKTDPYFLKLSQPLVYFCVFPRIYLSCIENCSEHQNKTIFGATQVNLGENTKVNKQSLVIFWVNLRKYGAVLYSFSCTVVPHIRIVGISIFRGFYSKDTVQCIRSQYIKVWALHSYLRLWKNNRVSRGVILY